MASLRTGLCSQGQTKTLWPERELIRARTAAKEFYLSTVSGRPLQGIFIEARCLNSAIYALGIAREPNMKLFLTACCAIAAISNASRAQATYCRVDATMQAMIKTVAPKTIIAETNKKCRQGDVIQLPQGSYVIAMLCDFSKQIAQAGHVTVCVFAGERAEQ